MVLSFAGLRPNALEVCAVPAVCKQVARSTHSQCIVEAKFMLPWSFSEEAAAEKHMAQVQHNMRVTNVTGAVLSIITGGGRWVEIQVIADSLLPRHLLLTAEKNFWRWGWRTGSPRPQLSESACCPS